jgi:hypothetical protein
LFFLLKDDFVFVRKSLYASIRSNTKTGLFSGTYSAIFSKEMQSSTRFPARPWLTEADKKSVDKLRPLLCEMVLDRIAPLSLPRITLDFDGSVQSTKRRAGVTVVGFN